MKRMAVLLVLSGCLGDGYEAGMPCDSVAWNDAAVCANDMEHALRCIGDRLTVIRDGGCSYPEMTDAGE